MDERQPLDDIAAQGAPASPDALRQIVARHRRSRTRFLGVALAVAVVAGPAAGWAIGHGSGGGQQVATSSATGSANTPQAPVPGVVGGTASGQAFAYPDKNPPKFTHLFNRTSSDGIAIRAYRLDPPPQPTDSSSTTTPAPKPEVAQCTTPGKPGAATAIANANSGAQANASASSGSAEGGQVSSGPGAPSGAPPPCPGLPPICRAPSPTVQAEVSNDAAVGQGFFPIDDKQPSEPLSHVSASPFGVGEGSPSEFVTVQTGAGVATVRLRMPSGGATDEMAPSGGIAVLAHGLPDSTVAGTVEALDSSGKVLASQDLAQPNAPKGAVACAFAGAPNVVRAVPAPATPPTTR